ncbi:MAG TPA: M20/M25/M40 family metallo-hydrolase [Anaerolineaceae bacterium]|nr:M20/M25/M40 family metallo-hydrolase [Anaerolineaceae bacterium]
MSNMTGNVSAPVIGAAQIALLERLSNACAVSGDEGEVRAIVLEQVKPYADEVKVDALGNVLVTHHASKPDALRVMLASHMDEVGFMIVDEEDGGLYRFEMVGGVDVRQLPGKMVWVGKQHIPGVIGMRPIHLTTADEREHSVPVESLRIDIGPGGAGKVKVGDRGTFATSFRQLGPSLCGKALDNRLGVTTLIELLKSAPANIELQLAFTVQEEIGLRGARVAAYALDPHLAIAIDSTPAHDLPMWDDSESVYYNTHLGEGPAIYVADIGTLSDPRLVQFLAQTAETLHIPYQIRQPGGGGTDAAAIHRQRAGIPSVSVSIPSRHPHTAALMARLSDWQNTVNLLHAFLVRVKPEILLAER